MLEVDGVDFQGAKGDLLQVVAGDNSTQDLTISNNNFTNLQARPSAGASLSAAAAPGSNINVDFPGGGQHLHRRRGTALTAIYGHQAGMVRGNIEGNTIGVDDGIAGTEGSFGGSRHRRQPREGAGRRQCQLSASPSSTTRSTTSTGFGGHRPALERAAAPAIRRVLEATSPTTTVDEFGDFAFAALYALVGGSAGPATSPSWASSSATTSSIRATPISAFNAIFLDQVSSDAHFYLPGLCRLGRWRISRARARRAPI